MRLTFVTRIVLLVVGLFLFLGGTALSQSKTLLKLKEDEKIVHPFYFYPSTLRMINLGGDKTYNDLVKDVRKLIFFKLKSDSFGAEDFDLTLEKLMTEELYEEYIVVEGGDQEIHMVGKTNSTVMLGYYDDAYYMAELQGNIDVMRVPELYNKIANADSTFQNNFLDVFDMLGIKEDKENTDRHNEEEKSPDDDPLKKQKRT